ncbi:MAG TPA: CcoQ/FixQ family Cbb3-type cytochrome c oxidase assembly chaperone [Chitinophagaceae bacterium]|jgi:cytochrome c oxidase cbb3-type subunit 3|nr:CcoQ/FixQ family Cbb3-type cytochrome c oxidase assembly chaperone [Chitinophagaceae bacterium]
MKFINYLKTIDGVGVFPLASLLIFFVFFVALLFFVIKADKKTLDKIKNIPFDN